MAKLSKISGFPEWLPEQKLAEERVIEMIRGIYRSFGFTPIETPAVELLSTLGAKGVIDKEIFAVRRLKSDEKEEAELGLHFDLTVPFARYVAQHQNELDFPFKRYQLQKVWRGERPQKGRFREFYQFDVDVIARNELPLACDAEVVSITALAMEAMNLGPFTIRLNSRRLLQGLYESLGLDAAARSAAISAVDKILKIGVEGVADELRKITGISQAAIDSIIESTAVRCSPDQLAERVAALGVQNEEFARGAEELLTVCELLPAAARAKVVVDMSLARGLDYYTGLVVEVVMDSYPGFGTVVSGGRYENLCGDFCDQKLPGVGVSIGLSRLMELAFTEKLINTAKKTPTQALVTVFSEGDRLLSNEIAQELRSAGLATEVYYRSPKLGKQIDYADAKGIRYVLFVDSATRQVEAKDLVTKEQVQVASLGEWARQVIQKGDG